MKNSGFTSCSAQNNADGKSEKLGFIPNPELYAPADDEVMFDNSVDALEFFQDFYDKDGIVLPACVSINCLLLPRMAVWLYFDIKNEEIVSLLPMFKLDNPDMLNDCEYSNLQPLMEEVYLFWKEQLYSTVITSTGEVCVKKVRTILSETNMLNILSLKGAIDVEDVYPVEIYSKTQEKFIAICWSIEQKDHVAAGLQRRGKAV